MGFFLPQSMQENRYNILYRYVTPNALSKMISDSRKLVQTMGSRTRFLYTYMSCGTVNWYHPFGLCQRGDMLSLAIASKIVLVIGLQLFSDMSIQALIGSFVNKCVTAATILPAA